MPDPRSVITVLAAILFLVAFFSLPYFASVVVHYLLRHSMKATAAGGDVSMLDVLGIRVRGNPPGLLIDAYLALRARGVMTNIREVERVYAADRGVVTDSDDLAQRVQQGSEPGGWR